MFLVGTPSSSPRSSRAPPTFTVPSYGSSQHHAAMEHARIGPSTEASPAVLKDQASSYARERQSSKASCTENTRASADSHQQAVAMLATRDTTTVSGHTRTPLPRRPTKGRTASAPADEACAESSPVDVAARPQKPFSFLQGPYLGKGHPTTRDQTCHLEHSRTKPTDSFELQPERCVQGKDCIHDEILGKLTELAHIVTQLAQELRQRKTADERSWDREEDISRTYTDPGTLSGVHNGTVSQALSTRG